MYLTILKMASPYLQRLVAKKVAEFLQSRREQRQAQPTADQADSRPAECPPCPPVADAAPARAYAATTSSQNTIWFALSGILLGTAFSAMVYIILRDANPRLQS